MTDVTPTIRDRVIELRRVPVRELLPNPRNWRRHPPAKEAYDRISCATSP